jgi:glutamate racemase
MLDAGIDTVVLGCTHYPFVIPLIERIAGPGVRVIDPAPAVARQARRLLEAHSGLEAQSHGEPVSRTRILTSGDSGKMAEMLHTLLGVEAEVGQVEGIFTRP